MFPYLFDETQEVAKAYRAACTPDFFLFDGDRSWCIAASSMRAGPKTAFPLRAAICGPPPTPCWPESRPATQKPSMGCNIKWKRGNAPEYFKT